MIICKHCRESWPTDAQFCGSCGGSFKGRRCRKGHLSPKRASACVTCGSHDLTDFADSLHLGTRARILACIVMLVALRILSVHAWSVLQTTDWLLGLVLPFRPLATALQIVSVVIVWLTFRSLLVLFAREADGRFKAVSDVWRPFVKAGFRALYYAARYGGTMVKRVVVGSEQPKSGRKR
ncbi:MAG: hypothetical protein JNK63_07140 [Chthonomonas sp.]|nr:hypothetical protein [Chthonomonas sp.]